jgi:hypothetical protein
MPGSSCPLFSIMGAYTAYRTGIPEYFDRESGELKKEMAETNPYHTYY